MERGFIEGYQQMVDRIDVSLPINTLGYHEPHKYLQDLFAEYANWKSELGYIKPEVTFECDPLAVPAMILALIAYGFKRDTYSLAFSAIVMLLAIIAMCVLTRPKVNCVEHRKPGGGKIQK